MQDGTSIHRHLRRASFLRGELTIIVTSPPADRAASKPATHPLRVTCACRSFADVTKCQWCFADRGFAYRWSQEQHPAAWGMLGRAWTANTCDRWLFLHTYGSSCPRGPQNSCHGRLARDSDDSVSILGVGIRRAGRFNSASLSNIRRSMSAPGFPFLHQLQFH